MSQARFLVGDVFERLAELPDASVDLVMTSPPFLALRSYLPSDHPDKAKEIGSEPTPGAFIDTLLDVVVELRRVLAPHGSLVFELGDTYAGSGGAGGDYGPAGLREGQPKFRQGTPRWDGRPEGQTRTTTSDPTTTSNSGGPGWPLDKSLCLIPQSFAWALSYGRNPFTGREIEPWRVRNVVAWCRPNPPVGALGDKFRPATSYLTVACMARDRYFDLDAVRSAHKEPERSQPGVSEASGIEAVDGSTRMGSRFGERVYNPAGAPPLDYWVIPTQPYKGSHYATFPTALCIKPIEAMCPRKVCRVCGEPSRRITAPTEDYAQHLGESWADRSDARPKASGTERNSHSGQPEGAHITSAQRETTGWTDCGHDDWRPGLVLDPFGGSGTVAEVATGHGRDCVLIDLDPRNAELAYERIGGLFLTIESQQGAA